MKRRGKNYRLVAESIDKKKDYSLEDAVALLKDKVIGKFDHTIELHMNLGVDPKHAEQVVRGNVVLPHGTGKKERIIAFARGDKAKEALAAGADAVGADDLIEKIQGGWLDFDKVVATPDMMPLVGKVARVLGPRGLMPNPKTGTVTMEIGKAIGELTSGKVSYRIDKGSNIHAAVGKLSFDKDKIIENARAMIQSVVKAKPASAKGEYMKSITVATTMSPGLALSKAVVK